RIPGWLPREQHENLCEHRRYTIDRLFRWYGPDWVLQRLPAELQGEHLHVLRHGLGWSREPQHEGRCGFPPQHREQRIQRGPPLLLLLRSGFLLRGRALSTARWRGSRD